MSSWVRWLCWPSQLIVEIKVAGKTKANLDSLFAFESCKPAHHNKCVTKQDSNFDLVDMLSKGDWKASWI